VEHSLPFLAISKVAGSILENVNPTNKEQKGNNLSIIPDLGAWLLYGIIYDTSYNSPHVGSCVYIRGRKESVIF
jgi:hypothetical protein